MLRPLKLSLISAGSLIAILLIIVLTVAASPWFAWQAGQADQADIAAAFRLAALPPEAAAKLRGYIPSKVAALAEGRYSYVTVIKQGSDFEFWLRPRLSQQVRAGRQLNQAGWHVERVGLWLAVKEDAPPTIQPSGLTTAWAGFKAWGRAAIQSDQFTYPAIMLRIAPGKLAAIPEGVALMSQKKGQLLAGHYNLGEIWPPERRVALRSPKEVENEERVDLLVALPSSFLSAVPSQLKQEWNHLLEEKLVISHARSTVLEEVPAYASVSVAVQGEDISLAVLDFGNQFKPTVEKWGAQETAYHAPTRRAFRLPDGTLGYESIPGELEAFLTLAASEAGCEGGRNEILQLWLCRHGNWAAVSRNQALAQKHAAMLAGAQDWQVYVRQPLAEKLGLPGLIAATLQAQAKAGSFMFRWQP